MTNKEAVNKRFNIRRWVAIFFFCLLVAGLSVQSAYSQYSGGSQSGSAQTTLGSDIYSGGAQSGQTTASTSSGQSLAHGPAAKLVFTVSPSSAKHFKKFARQPVVAVEDADLLTSGKETSPIPAACDASMLGSAPICASACECRGLVWASAPTLPWPRC